MAHFRSNSKLLGVGGPEKFLDILGGSEKKMEIFKFSPIPSPPPLS